MAKRKNLKEILILLRDFSQLMIQLGYAAIMEESIELAKEALLRAKYKLSVKTKIIAAHERSGG